MELFMKVEQAARLFGFAAGCVILTGMVIWLIVLYVKSLFEKK